MTADAAAEPARVYRARFGIQLSAGASTGDHRFYTDRAHLEYDLLVANLDLVKADGKHGSARQNTARRWLEVLRGDGETYPTFKNIFAVEQLVDGEWIPLEVTFTQPQVHVEGIQ